MKRGEAERLTPEQAGPIAQWRHEILTLAREEKAQQLLKSNLLTALGGGHFGRMNFPIPPGSLPADMQVRPAPFERETLQQMVWLERPPQGRRAHRRWRWSDPEISPRRR